MVIFTIHIFERKMLDYNDKHIWPIICLIGYKGRSEEWMNQRTTIIMNGKSILEQNWLFSGKTKPGCLGRLEETAFSCRDHSRQERYQLRRGPQHWRPLRLHGDLGADGVPRGAPLGRLSILEQALPGWHVSIKYRKILQASFFSNILVKTLILTALQRGSWLW